MAGKKDAAWWREYRERNRLKQQESRGLQEPGATPQQAAQHDVAAGPIMTDVRPMVEEARANLPAVIRDAPLYDFRPRHVVRPAFLSAPDDDCAACGHDRQAFHLPADLPCRGPSATRKSCGCPSFVDSSDPF